MTEFIASARINLFTIKMAILPKLIQNVKTPALTFSDIGYVISTLNSYKNGFAHPKKKPANVIVTHTKSNVRGNIG